MTGRRNPFEEIEEMMNRMSRQFEESMGGPEIKSLTSGQDHAPVDIADHEEKLVVTADLPGYQTEDIDLTLRDDQLRIDAEREEKTEEADEEDGRYIRKERRHEAVSRSVTLPEEVDEENISAQFQNGVLTVTLPKKHDDEGDSHQINIE